MATRLVTKPTFNINKHIKSKTTFSSSTWLSTSSQQGSVRYGGGGLKEVRRRIASVKMISKITKTMKMIATSRTKSAQRRMERSRPFFNAATAVTREFPKDVPVKTSLFIPICSDRGLCGGINSGLSKLLKPQIREAVNKGEEVSILCIGDKGSGQFAKEFGNRVLFTAGGTSRTPFNFMGLGWVIDKAIKTVPNVDRFVIGYNKSTSSVSFTPVSASLIAYNPIKENAEVMSTFEFEEEATLFHLQDLIEFQLTSLIYGGVMENYTAELAARTAAMDSATRNANEITKKLTTKYNRARQASITTELTEIISGKAAIEDA
jgi:F-type H+-transporting ATPase subunit gamma